MGAPLAPFGTRMTVCSLTPSRIGTMTSRRTWSNASVTGANFAGVSLRRVWASRLATTGKEKAIATSAAPTSRRWMDFIRCPPACENAVSLALADPGASLREGQTAEPARDRHPGRRLREGEPQDVREEEDL